MRWTCLWPLTVSLALSQEPPAGLLIEAEAYRARHHADAAYGSISNEASASGAKVVTRVFLNNGWLLYDVPVETGGTYHVWLRYASKNDVPIPVAADPADPPEFVPAASPTTGELTGQDAFGWCKLLTVDWQPGPHQIALGSAPKRYDALFITTSDQPVTDDVIPKQKPLDPETMAKIARPLTPVRPDWLAGAADYQLPAWYEQYRVHAHTRLSPAWIDKPTFDTAADDFAAMGIHVFARHIKSGGEGAWWPSAIGAVLPQVTEGRNVAKEIIDAAHANGQQILVYHRHMEDAWVAEQHPDWRCIGPYGTPVEKRGPKVCFNSPYREFFLQRMLELAALGADAFYFDEVHMPKEGCWCSFCRAEFTRLTGLAHPPAVDPTDPLWHKLIDFNNRTIEELFLNYRRELHAKYPNVVMMIGSNTWPTMLERHTTHRLYGIADSMKTEFNLPARGTGGLYPLPEGYVPTDPAVKIPLGYTLARDACDGRPAHIWCHGLQSADCALYAAAGMVCYGNIANLDVPEATIAEHNSIFPPAFALGDKVSPYLAGRRPVRHVAIHYNEWAKDHLVFDVPTAWQTIFHPLYSAFQACFEARIPCGIVTDSQLEEGALEGYRVLFLPSDDLTAPMRAAVAKFEQDGGRVVRQQADWQWWLPEGAASAKAAFLAEVAQAGPAPVRVEGGPDRLNAVAFTGADGNLTIALANAFTWVYTGSAGKNPPKPEQLTPPPPVKDAVVVLQGAAPKRVFEAVTRRELPVQMVGETCRIAVPEFGPMACVVVER